MPGGPAASSYAHYDTLFLLSPARVDGERAKLLARGGGDAALAAKLQSVQGATLCEVFSFLSSLYFRGKLTYARAFCRPPRGVAGISIITAEGLKPEDEPIDAAKLRALAGIPIDERDPRYAAPLLRDASALARAAGDYARFVLLGSVASSKYVQPLLRVMGPRLLFPADFVGRGDMSRGGLLLRAARAGVELEYLPVQGAQLHGARPPKLPKPPRQGDGPR